jgi:Spirocyclase AveC-like
VTEVQAPPAPKPVPVSEPQVNRPRPVLWWAAFGAAAIAVQIYVYVAWIASDDFETVSMGPDAVPTSDKVWAWILQVSFTLIALLAVAYVIRGCIRSRRLTLDAKLAIGFVSLIWLDPIANFIRPQWSYNAYYVNHGSWTEHIPGWIGDTGRVPQSLLVEAPAYFLLIFVAIAGCAFMRWVKRRRPETSNFGLVIYLWLFMSAFVFVFEWPVMIATGFARYLQVPRDISLLEGQELQYLWFEMLGWAVMLTAVTALRFFLDDRGRTKVEQGIDRVSAPKTAKTALATFSIVGWATAFMCIYGLTVAPLTFWGNDTPDLPSYYHTDLCDSPGAPPCPGPDVPIQLRN